MAISKKQVLNSLCNTAFYIVGSLAYSIGINSFAVPNNIAEGGVTGLAIVAHYWFNIPIGVANFLINLPLFILAWFILGKKFVGRTLWVVAILSACLDLTSMFFPVYTGDSLLASLFCGALTGIGLALVMMRGATTGGTDIAGKLVQKFKPHVSLGSLIAFFNAIVVAIAAVSFRSVESALYAVVVIVVSGKVLDYILYGLGRGKLLMVITEKPQEMSEAIISQVGRGVSIVPITGAYTGDSKEMLVVAIHNNDTSKINKILRTVDPNAFTIITEAGEILGNGFKSRENL